jgi:Glycosyltransferase family 17
MRFIQLFKMFSFLIFLFVVYYHVYSLKALLNRSSCLARPVVGLNGEKPFSSYPKYNVDELYREEHKKIDNSDGNQRCERYGLALYNGTKPRRIFFGATVADDNWEMFLIHAIEAYDIYHMAVFVESNTTFLNTPRALRFKDSEESNKLRYAKLFGPKTQIFIDHWLVDMPDLVEMTRESEQRNEIIKRWKEEGMTVDDVGILSDIDEMYSRDFLRALQTCDFPELRPNQDCHKPKILPSAIAFEASPLCIKQERWFHPDAIAGQCIDGIGDPSERVVPLRDHRRRFGERDESYGKSYLDSFPEAVVKLGRYPLFNGPDFRTVIGDRGYLYNVVNESLSSEDAIVGAAYHLHNWFSDFKVLRHKYMTYGHPDDEVMEKSLSQMGEDLDIMVRCSRDIGNDVVSNDWAMQYYEGVQDLQGNRPIFFLNKSYTTLRHNNLRELVFRDEAEFGSSYDKSGNLVEAKMSPNDNE